MPRLATLLEARQRTIAHVVVEADRAGADLVAYDGGDVVSTEQVDGDTLHIHRGHPGGWSQRRFQQRAENTWERNADDVAAAVAAMSRDVDAHLVAVAGDVRAQTLVLAALPHDVARSAVKIDVGSAEGIAEEVVRLLSDVVARRVAGLADELRSALSANTGAVGVDDTLAALTEGRVRTLLVHDDGTDEPTTSGRRWRRAGARVVMSPSPLRCGGRRRRGRPEPGGVVRADRCCAPLVAGLHPLSHTVICRGLRVRARASFGRRLSGRSRRVRCRIGR